MSEIIKFHKYQGAGNDFILIDNRTTLFDETNNVLIEKLCDRRFGIGADGLMLLQDNKNFDFEMKYYNADGKQGSMCGNGGRCIVAFARDLGIIEHNTAFLAVDGPHEATIQGNQVDLGMIDVHQIQRDDQAYVLNTGSPHYVQLVDQLDKIDMRAQGMAIRNNETYRLHGINVNFVQPQQDGYFLRTYERGVEDETLACGTGATAAAIAMAIHTNQSGHIQIPIRVLGGQLYISFYREGQSFTNVRLIGPANLVFQGEI